MSDRCLSTHTPRPPPPKRAPGDPGRAKPAGHHAFPGSTAGAGRAWAHPPVLSRPRRPAQPPGTRGFLLSSGSCSPLRPKALERRLGAQVHAASPQARGAPREPPARGDQRTSSFDCLRFPTLSQRCSGPGDGAATSPPERGPARTPPAAPGVRRSRIRWFAKSCVSHDVSQLAALFIDA